MKKPYGDYCSLIVLPYFPGFTAFTMSTKPSFMSFADVGLSTM